MIPSLPQAICCPELRLLMLLLMVGFLLLKLCKCLIEASLVVTKFCGMPGMGSQDMLEVVLYSCYGG